MSNPGYLKIFSSHCWDYSNHRQGLHSLIGGEWVKNVDYVDLSIPRAHPVDVESDIDLAGEIRDRIRASDVFLVFAGMYVNGSEWVKFEIHSAFNDECPIIAVIPNGQQRLSRTATRFATAQVHWRAESVRAAIWDALPEHRRKAFIDGRRARAAAASAPLILQSSRAAANPPPPISVFDLLAAAPPPPWRKP